MERLLRRMGDQNELINYLHEASKKKDDQIADLENQLSTTSTDQQHALAMQGEEIATKRDELEHQLSQQKIKIKGLEDEVRNGRICETENRLLRQEMGGLREEMSMLERKQIEEIQVVRDEFVNFKHKLRHEFRKSLKEAEEDTREQVEQILDAEAKASLEENVHLKEHLSRQTESIDVVLSKYKTSEMLFKKIKCEHDITQQNYETEVKRLVAAKKKILELETKNAQLSETIQRSMREKRNVAQMKVELDDLQDQKYVMTKTLKNREVEIASLKSEVAALKQKFASLQKHMKAKVSKADTFADLSLRSTVPDQFIPELADWVKEQPALTMESTMRIWNSRHSESRAGNENDSRMTVSQSALRLGTPLSQDLGVSAHPVKRPSSSVSTAPLSVNASSIRGSRVSSAAPHFRQSDRTRPHSAADLQVLGSRAKGPRN